MAHDLIGKAKSEGRSILTEIEAKEVLKDAGIPVTETRPAKSKEEAVSLSRELGFPSVMKIISNDISHKSDAGGVALDLANEQDVEKAYNDMMKSARDKFPNAALEGVSIQKMIAGGIEVIMGMSRDPQFGPMLMFGLGGVFVELLKDVAFRIVPLTRKDAEEMVSEIKGRPLLQGFRGTDPVNEEAIVDALYSLSEFIGANPEIEELDMNPLLVDKDGIIAVDARIVI